MGNSHELNLEDPWVVAFPAEGDHAHGHNDSLSVLFRCDSKLGYLGPSVLNYIKKLERENRISFLHAQTRHFERDIAASHFIQHASLSTCIRYTLIEKAFDQNLWRSQLLQDAERAKKATGMTGVSLIWMTTLFPSSCKNAKLLVKAWTDSLIIPLFPLPSTLVPFTSSVSIDAMIPRASKVLDPQKGGGRGYPVPFDASPNVMLENKGTGVSTGLMFL